MWSVEFLDEAEEDLRKLDRAVRRRVIEKIEWLQENFDTLPPLTLQGEFKNFFKLRAGDWRVFYKVNWKLNRIVVCYIQRRDKAYKKPKR